MNQQIQLAVVVLLMNDSETVSILGFHWEVEFLKQLTKKGTNDVRQNSGRIHIHRYLRYPWGRYG